MTCWTKIEQFTLIFITAIGKSHEQKFKQNGETGQDFVSHTQKDQIE